MISGLIERETKRLVLAGRVEHAFTIFDRVMFGVALALSCNASV